MEGKVFGGDTECSCRYRGSGKTKATGGRKKVGFFEEKIEKAIPAEVKKKKKAMTEVVIIMYGS